MGRRLKGEEGGGGDVLRVEDPAALVDLFRAARASPMDLAWNSVSTRPGQTSVTRDVPAHQVDAQQGADHVDGALAAP